ncbi:hypothetical protein [Tianweitania sediminis]|uniref:Uncharacterized protein n=1 Tax=Tianweitania sediminis TaxID=1502156 RepID=A0A8J7RQL0_9HYPH|nr:hypothetical protein [Tianweitania sediminis]MBP0441351.1 hypothetical protein [Tianweitania sediminis]
MLSIDGTVMFIHSKNRPAAPLNPAVASIAMELGNEEQVERLILAVETISAAIRDEKQGELRDRLQNPMEELRRRKR